MCVFSEIVVEKAFWQCEQEYGRSPRQTDNKSFLTDLIKTHQKNLEIVGGRQDRREEGVARV